MLVNKSDDKLFTVVLGLAHIALFGLEALDTCRRLGLPDATKLETDTFMVREIEVSETIARAYEPLFRKNRIAYCVVELSSLTNGMAQLTEQSKVMLKKDWEPDVNFIGLQLGKTLQKKVRAGLIKQEYCGIDEAA